MSFENIIKKLSSFIAAFVVFFIAAGMYLSWKGFVMQPDGKIVLVKQAQAALLDNNGDESISTPIANNIALSLPKGPILGSSKAPLTLYEFSSFGCSHCADFHLNTLPLLEQDYISQGKLKVIFVNFPLERKSMQGALIAKCIPDKNYYEFIKTAFKNQREWYFSSSSEKIFSDYAAHNGLSKTKAAECLKNDDNAKDIIEIRQQPIDKLKRSGTPSFLLTSRKDREVIYGVPSYESLQKLLDKKLLSSKN